MKSINQNLHLLEDQILYFENQGDQLDMIETTDKLIGQKYNQRHLSNKFGLFSSNECTTMFRFPSYCTDCLSGLKGFQDSYNYS